MNSIPATPISVRVGFMPLTDCASLVMAAKRGFDLKYGIRIELSRETSWATLRDKLGSGALDAAHALYGMVCGVQLGIGGQRQEMAVLMNLSRNGQAITLSRALAGQGALSGADLARRVLAGQGERAYTFAQTFPTGNHAMLLYYWLAANGVDPFRDVRTVTVPPPQMVSSLKDGSIDGFCVGEPWGERAVQDEIGVTAVTSQQIWPDHPGKVLAARAAYVKDNPDTSRALVAAILDAARWIEESEQNKLAAADVLAGSGYLSTNGGIIAPRLLGEYRNGLGSQWKDLDALAFYGDGAVAFPYLSDAMWFMTQHRRWGLLKEDPDYLGVAGELAQLDLYRDAARMSGTPAPVSPMRRSTLIDGALWDGSDPAAYAASFDIHHR